MKKFLGETFYNAKDIAKKLDVSIATADRYMRKGRIESVKISNYWYCSEYALKHFLFGKYADDYEQKKAEEEDLDEAEQIFGKDDNNDEG